MTFTQSEIIAFNSVLDGKNIFGTHFKAPREPDDSYVQQTVGSLREKGFLDKDNNPNKLFALAANMLSDYKRARKHLFINRARIAVDGTKATILTQTSDGFDLTQTNKTLFFQSLLLGTPYLRQEDPGELSTKALAPKQWAREVGEKEVGDQFWLHQFENQTLTQTFVLYHIENQGFAYDPTLETLTSCGPQFMRATIMDMLGIEKEGVE